MKQKFSSQKFPNPPKAKKPLLKIIPLGGCGEIGKNMTIFEYGNDMIVVDCGLMFPQDEMLGVDFVIPNINYILQNRKKLQGMIITHGHEDHIGGLPYILPKITPQIYTTKLTKGLIEVKLSEFKLKKPKINSINPGQKIKLGCFQIEPFHVTHSIPDCIGLAITTPVGLVIHTADFKFDPTPVEGKPTDLKELAKFGQRGVLILLSDSTNAEVEGHTPSERTLSATFDKIFRESRGRIIVTSFASLINRIQQVINSAATYGRKVAISGRSMSNNIKIALKLGYLKIPPNILVPLQEAIKMPDHKIAIMCTGSQGEEMSALVRMSSGDHKQIKIKKGDTVVISASPIPGNERSISNTINDLFREGARVIYGKQLDIHVSGHASREELKQMINLIKPKFFIPIHGEYRHLHLHGKLAEKAGVKKENVFLIENGEVLEVGYNLARKSTQKVPAGLVMVDGIRVGDVGEVVLRDRHLMAQDGIFVIITTIDKKTGQLLTSPDIISRGFVYMKASEDLIKKTKEEVVSALRERNGQYPANWTFIKNKIRNDIAEFLFNQTGRRPMVLPVIIEV